MLQPTVPQPAPPYTWQGRPAQPHALQQLAITLTVKLGATERNYSGMTTDASGFFSVSVDLPNGPYNWRVKGPNAGPGGNTLAAFLANSGSFGLVRGTTQQVEMGLMRAGDANNDNLVNINDFAILRNSFGKMFGQPGYDARADFNGDQVVNAQDQSLLSSNFGSGGAPVITPPGKESDPLAVKGANMEADTTKPSSAPR